MARTRAGYVVAVDTVGAGFHERVLVVAGSSARLAQNMKDMPIDAAVVGVIDTVDINESGVWSLRSWSQIRLEDSRPQTPLDSRLQTDFICSSHA